ncbi:glyoxalase/bleomycin resistance/dioxygenase family protein [Pontibacillus sp. HMF3514]|nr:glyoxalase/bleomycin resistance/dioxygenase family protein [Pontibacillus sp. HMF3514]
MKVHHVGIHVSDLERSYRFYNEYFGFQAGERFSLGEESILFLEKGEVKLELFASESQPVQTENHLCCQVESVDELRVELKQKGLFPREGPIAVGNGWRTVFYEGPDHEMIEVLEVKR